jgi:predicted SnoaL-like aldol condensation-catalyzing enzyme
MSTIENKAITRRLLEAWNTRSVSILENLVDETFTADFVVHDKGQPGMMIGREGVKQFMRRVLKNTPDIHITIKDMIAEGDRVATLVTISATNALSGKLERTVDMKIRRFANGLIAEQWAINVRVDPQA